MTNELLSVIVPVYNSERFLDLCLTSILNQSYVNFEVILVNDGSTDDSENICLKFCNLDSRFKYFKKENAGASSARNFGLDHCQGDYISFIDSDDYIELDMFDKMINAMMKFDCDIVICGRYKDYDKKIKKVNCSNHIKQYSVNKSICNMMANMKMDFSPCDKLYRRNLWKDIYFPIGVTGEDMLVLPKVFEKAKKIIHIGLPLYHYRYNSNSVTTSSFNEHTFDSKKAIEYFSSIYHNGSLFERLSLQSFITIQYNYYLQKSYTYEGTNDELFKEYIDYLKKHIFQIIMNPRIKSKTKMMTFILLTPNLYKKFFISKYK